ncbi:MAG TPA: hypothetical protein PKI03_08625 [Pseudomonadota bacterium]|nr:hypothetical protein [Pseudomonadota bacterium]
MAQLSNCIIVSARVLGLRKILRRKPNSLAPQAMAGLREVLGTLKTPETAIQIEDRLLLICPVPDDEEAGYHAQIVLAELMQELAFLQLQLAETDGLFLSGALVLGQVLAERTQGRYDLSGPGVRHAHRVARDNRAPCLLFDRPLANRAALYFDAAEPPTIWQHVQHDGWGRYFLDYLSLLSNFEPSGRSSLWAIVGHHKAAIQRKLGNERSDHPVPLAPWLSWLLCYHNRVVRRMSALPQQFAAAEEIRRTYEIDSIRLGFAQSAALKVSPLRLVEE